MDGGAWWATVHGVAKSRTRLSGFTSCLVALYNLQDLSSQTRALQLAYLIAQLVKNPPAMQETLVRFLRASLPTPVFLGFPYGLAGEESACNAGDLGSIPGLRRSPGEGKGYPLQYSGLKNSMDYTAYGVAESDTTEQLSLHLRWKLRVLTTGTPGSPKPLF